MNLFDVLAYIATAVILGAYATVARRPQHMRLFNVANLAGGAVLLVYNLRHHATASAVLNGAYMLIALRALIGS